MTDDLNQLEILYKAMESFGYDYEDTIVKPEDLPELIKIVDNLLIQLNFQTIQLRLF